MDHGQLRRGDPGGADPAQLVGLGPRHGEGHAPRLRGDGPVHARARSRSRTRSTRGRPGCSTDAPRATSASSAWSATGCPGSSGDIIEEKVFGNPATGPPRASRWGSTRAIRWCSPSSCRQGGPRAGCSPGCWRTCRAWWRQATLDAPPADLEAAQRLMIESVERFEEVDLHHCVVSMIAPGMLEAPRQARRRRRRRPLARAGAGERVRRHGGDPDHLRTSGPRPRGSWTSPRSSAATASTARTRGRSRRSAGERTPHRSRR